ncbi:MAG: hypothetical protein GX049_13025 [Alcaligenaceae bacterium]|nr:hypothetical protein [Alcaligenaceae bacterium]
MKFLQKVPGSMRSAPGLEWALWKRLPLFLLVGTLVPVIVAAILWWYRLESVDPATNRDIARYFYIAVGTVVLHWTLMFALAIGCVVVMVMKGPAYVADAGPLMDADAPKPLNDTKTA